MTKDASKHGVSRISVSLPESLLIDLDQMVNERGFESRSHAISSMIHRQLMDHRHEHGNEIMAGTINLVYKHRTPGLQKQLSDLQHEYIDEVISSLHINLMHAQTLEVILVQGPAQRLKEIAHKLESCRGVISGKLQMSTALLPPVHPLPVAESA
ncbi:MAG TPA: nickel-responsive transcriptional regulator NikR [Gammaproteobacteria bacterium]